MASCLIPGLGSPWAYLVSPDRSWKLKRHDSGSHLQCPCVGFSSHASIAAGTSLFRSGRRPSFSDGLLRRLLWSSVVFYPLWLGSVPWRWSCSGVSQAFLLVHFLVHWSVAVRGLLFFGVIAVLLVWISANTWQRASSLLEAHLAPPGTRGEMANGGPAPVAYFLTQYVKCCSFSLCSDSPWSSQPQPMGSGGDATPCKVTREDHGLSF